MERNVKWNITVFFWTTLEPAFVLVGVSSLVVIVIVVLIVVVLIVIVLVVVPLVVVTGLAVLAVDVSATGNVKLKLLHKFVRQHRDSKTLLFIVWQKSEHPAWNFSTPKFHLNDWKTVIWFSNKQQKKDPKIIIITEHFSPAWQNTLVGVHLSQLLHL